MDRTSLDKHVWDGEWTLRPMQYINSCTSLTIDIAYIIWYAVHTRTSFKSIFKIHAPRHLSHSSDFFPHPCEQFICSWIDFPVQIIAIGPKPNGGLSIFRLSRVQDRIRHIYKYLQMYSTSIPVKVFDSEPLMKHIFY